MKEQTAFQTYQVNLSTRRPKNVKKYLIIKISFLEDIMKKKKIRIPFYAIKEHIAAALGSAAIFATVIVPGTLCCLIGAGLVIGESVEHKKAVENYATSSKYAAEYNSAKDAEMQRYEEIEQEVMSVHEEFLNGKMTASEYEEKIEDLRREIVYGKRLDARLFENSNNPEIVAQKKKMDDMGKAGFALLISGMSIGAIKVLLRAFEIDDEGAVSRGMDIIEEINYRRDDNIESWYGNCGNGQE